MWPKKTKNCVQENLKTKEEGLAMTSTELPKIAERVKFWEEQDRINKIVIPRLLKNHDLISEVAKQVALFSDSIVKINAKYANIQSQIEALQNKVQGLTAPDKKAFIISTTALIFALVAIAITILK